MASHDSSAAGTSAETDASIRADSGADTGAGTGGQDWIAQRAEKKVDYFLANPDYKPVPLHAEVAEKFYQRIIKIGKAVLRVQGIRVYVDGVENIPAHGGALLAANHTGYYDFMLAAVPAYLRGKRLVRFMAKKEIFDVKGVGRLMRSMGHIPVDRSRGADSIGVAEDALRKGALVAIFPEATISRSFELKDFKSGATRIAHGAGVPLIPVVIWGSQRIWTKDGKKHLGRNNFPIVIKVGQPVSTEGTAEEATARLKAAMAVLLSTARDQYETRFGPFAGGEKWRPASLGGGAPTLEEANAMDVASRAQKAARREEKETVKTAKENRRIAKTARKKLKKLARWGRKDA